MTRARTRVPQFVLLHVLLYGLLPATAPSDPMGPRLLADAPDAEVIALLEGIAGWVDPARTDRGSFQEAQTMSFDLFRSFHNETDRDIPLQEIPFGDAIRWAADRHGVDGLLVASVVEAESSFDPLAVSRKGAVGLMQLMPTTAALIGDDTSQLTEPYRNLDLGTRYLGQLLNRYEGDLAKALAAYNAGPGNVDRYGGLPPFRETQRYVEKVFRLYVDHHRSVWEGSELGELLMPVSG